LTPKRFAAKQVGMRPARYSVFLIILFAAFSFADSVRACSVPVFRYALEHWTPDAYEALVFHRGELDADSQALIKRLTREESGTRANVSVMTIDLAGDQAAKWQPVWKSFKADKLPWIAVRPAPRTGITTLLTSEALTEGLVDHLLDSPARRDYRARLAAGDSAVWILVESGNAEADNAAATALDQRINYLNSVLKVPELSDEDVANGLVSISSDDLKLQFSTLRVSRADAAERLFVKMLLGVESDLGELNDPMVFPVFGQGRALYALVGAGINDETIDMAGIFLSGKCSCEVKEENPGLDLLMTANWKQISKLPGKRDQRPAQSDSKPQNSGAPEMVKISAVESEELEDEVGEVQGTGRRFGIVPFILLFASLVFVFRKA
tara:strand:+ start:3254 stop:4396 length:1143 start_codon:yes stop_codon:yes gene_type:complete